MDEVPVVGQPSADALRFADHTTRGDRRCEVSGRDARAAVAAMLREQIASISYDGTHGKWLRITARKQLSAVEDSIEKDFLK